jgi:hypothetical protein
LKGTYEERYPKRLILVLASADFEPLSVRLQTPFRKRSKRKRGGREYLLLGSHATLFCHPVGFPPTLGFAKAKKFISSAD